MGWLGKSLFEKKHGYIASKRFVDGTLYDRIILWDRHSVVRGIECIYCCLILTFEEYVSPCGILVLLISVHIAGRV
jgi:hypothetical protein